MRKINFFLCVALFATLLLTSCKKDIEVSAIILDTGGLALEVGDEYTLMATIIPDNATNKTVTWVSGNSAVASVTANGKVTALSVGSTVITAQIGDKFTACAVVVTAPIPVVSITLDKTTLSLGIGDEYALTATVVPSTYTKPVTWSSSNTAVATVTSGVVKGAATGTAVITAQAGDKTATCTVYVADVTSIKLDKTNLSISIGDEYVLTANVVPASAAGLVTWTSSNTAVATVASGVVKGAAAGTATITAQVGDKTADCAVTVVDPTYDAGVVIGGKKWATRNVGAPGKFATAPQDPGMFYQWNRNIGWSSSNPLVNSNGSYVWDSTYPTGTSWTSANNPCPAGWRVPTINELRNLVNAGYYWTNAPTNGLIFGSGSNTIFLPAAGDRDPNGALSDVGSWGYYWSSTDYDGVSGAFGLIFTNNYIDAADEYYQYRNDACSVRCVGQ